MDKLLLEVPYDVRMEFEAVFGADIPESMWQLLFSRFLNKELRGKLHEIRKIESIVSKSKLTQEQADELADEVSLSIAKRFLESAGVEYPREDE